MTVAEQREIALRSGDRNRLARATDRHRLRSREIQASDLIADPPEHWQSALLYDLLLSVPRFGQHKLRAFNAKAMRGGVNVCAPLGGLAPRQRRFVIGYLRERGL